MKHSQRTESRFVLLKVFCLFGICLLSALGTAQATVSVSSLFGTGMVLQRDQPVPVWGSAGANKTITVIYNGQTKTATSDAQGNWQLTLDPMGVKTTGSNLTITETGANTLTFSNVVVGDVWYCSGQSNMDMWLASCNRQTDIDSANFPNLRHIRAPMVTSRDPLRTISSSWSVCSPSTAGSFSAAAFYFGRKIYQDQTNNIPIGLITTSIGGTVIDIWLAPEGLTDIPVIQPLFTQEIMPWGPFCSFNGMVYPFAPFGAKGMIWYQGENREKTNQSTDSYYLKEKALQQGWRRALGLNDFALYVVQLANWLDASTTTTPDGWGSWSDTRQMQEMVARLPHGGMASALDVGEAADIHPKDKLDVGERLALWALKNDYGRTTIVPSGPILKDVNVVNSTATYPTRKSVVCSFDYTGSGLMVGSKTPYLPTTEVVGGTLQRFVIAGSSGTWYAADAVINGDTVEISSASVTTPTKVAYAYWMNPAGANLYNREGLPASPFLIEDLAAKYTITATAGTGGTISPAGAATYLKRRNPLYVITPDPGYFIQDVKVDNVTVGSVNAYTFDPLYANHTIAVTFAAVAPTYTVTTAATGNGTLSPSGPVTITQSGAQTFKMVPNANCRLISTTLDGAPLGNRTSVTVTDVRTNHAVSAFFAPIPAPGAGTGLRGDYYDGANFEVFRATRTDATINFDWGTGTPFTSIPADAFTVRWSGQIQPQFSETYKFYVTHDDGVRLWVNNTLLVNNWTAAATDDNGSIALTAGTKYDIKLEYVDLTGTANCKLEWFSPSLPREIVPQTQLFPATTPIYTLTATPGANGAFNPTGAVLVVTGSNQTFNVVPATGYSVADVKVDNASIGIVNSYTFTNVTANHAITATFTALPSYAVSGKVTTNGTSTAISGAKVNFYTGSDMTAAAYTATTDLSGNYTVNIPMGTWYVTASAANYFNSSTRLLTVSDAAVTNINFGLVSNTRNIPNTPNILFSAVTDTLPASGSTGAWATYAPSGQTLTTIGSPTVETIMGRKWEKNIVADGDGFQFGSTYSSAIACSGASIVVAAKPMRSPDSGNWRSLVDIFYDRLVLGIMNNDGTVCVRRNGSVDFSSTKIPEGRTTILSMVVATDGSYNVYTNGGASPILSGAATGANTFVSLNPLWNGGGTGFWSYMNVGRNAPDGWTTSNGYIGDVFVYKAALTLAERQQIETDMMSKFVHGGVTTYTINASAGAGGAISLPGSTTVNPGASQGYTITPNTGYRVSDVTVDGVSVGALTTYTFSNVNAPHAISAKFTAITYTITASAGANGSISPAGGVSVNYGANQAFTFAPAAGYGVAQVTIDGVNQGALAGYTFSNVTANHTINVTFALLTHPITASAGPNGAITPSGTVLVNHGADQSFTVNPETGYQILQVAVDGLNQGPLSSYTFTNVTVAHSIAATFTPIIYTITASAGANGSIAPNGAVTVNHGSTQVFTVTPDSGFEVSQVLVDGENQGAISTYSFNSVTANHTIAASFKATVAPAPQFYSVQLQGTDLELKFFGGTNQDVRLLSATNATEAAANWVPIQTNSVGADGLGTNLVPVVPSTLQRYFKLAIP